ncbi:MAG: ATP-binding protein, partial [Synergistaceae bacterium]|nr:ATP-binding protein [Synergistaceae bacterium]
FTKIESGRLELTPAPYETASMLNDVLTIVRVQVKEKAEKPLELIVEADPAIPCGMIGDAGRVKQVLLNLMSNAVKYTNEGFIRFSASGERVAENTVRLTFMVEDSGIGIKPEDMPKLFGDFTRFDEKRNSAIEGAGLGLSITRSMCRAMKGDITASSEYGKGSVFTATLIQDVADWEPVGDLPAVSATVAAPQRITFVAPDARVLVVDDLPTNLMLAKGLLRPYKMSVFTCLNGREAVNLAATRSFDLVLMDHMMSEMDGMEAMQAIRALGERFAELPIVVLTAHAISGMKEMFLAGGFDDFLSKPIETDKLDAMLKRWIPAGKQQNVPEGMEIPPNMVGAAKAELGIQQLDLFNHYRWHFINGLPVDQAYCEKFTALAEALGMTELAAAGRRGDAEEIRRLLPEAYETTARNDGHTLDDLEDTLSRLKTALDRDDAQNADAAMEELRSMDGLSASARELYFFLYNAILMGDTEKAAGGLDVWKILGRAG